MVDVQQIATNVALGDSGIWFARGHGEVSYPASGHSICLQLEDRSFWFRHRNRCILELLRIFPPSGPFLDIGGGNGFVSCAIERAGMDVALLEPGLEGAQSARRRGLKTVICCTFEDLGLIPESIDAAGLFDVLEHIADDTEFLRRVRAALRPRGRVYLTVPAREFLWSTEDTAAGHYRRYSPKSLVAPLERAGFDIEFLTTIFWLLPVPIFHFRVLPSRMGIRRNEVLAHAQAEHLTNAGPLRAAVEWLQSAELVAIRSRRVALFGASLLVAASKSGH
jgi:SAM-dependent methyltransferase